MHAYSIVYAEHASGDGDSGRGRGSDEALQGISPEISESVASPKVELSLACSVRACILHPAISSHTHIARIDGTYTAFIISSAPPR